MANEWTVETIDSEFLDGAYQVQDQHGRVVALVPADGDVDVIMAIPRYRRLLRDVQKRICRNTCVGMPRHDPLCLEIDRVLFDWPASRTEARAFDASKSPEPPSHQEVPPDTHQDI